MIRIVPRSVLVVMAAMPMLSGCASHRIGLLARIGAAPKAQLADEPPPPPVPPAGIPAGLAVPAQGADGEYLTLNHGIAPADAVWHVRAALNVAALGCRGEQEKAIIAAYNAMLRTHKAALAGAFKTIQTRYRAEDAHGWQDRQDSQMTRVYNFFAQPAAQQRFCEIAAAVLTEAKTVPPGRLTPFAIAALPRLEAPFTDVYRAYDQYRRELAAWQARYDTVAQAAPQTGEFGRAQPIRREAHETRVDTASR